jgi:hypothetical protein
VAQRGARREVMEVACEVCEAKDDTEANPILLCDGPHLTEVGYHARCLRPLLLAVPDEDWFCPTCVLQLQVCYVSLSEREMFMGAIHLAGYPAGGVSRHAQAPPLARERLGVERCVCRPMPRCRWVCVAHPVCAAAAACC